MIGLLQTSKVYALLGVALVALLSLSLSSCAKRTQNPLGASVANSIPDNIDDPLGIGFNPKPAAKQAIPALINPSGKPLAPLVSDARDFVAIFNQGGGVISVWSSAPASWVWAHSAALNPNFGDGFNWIVQPISDGFVRFVNKLTRTCLNVYGHGVIHYPCDANNPNQFFRILPMDNGAIALQSASTQSCLQTGMHTKTNTPITLGKCLQVANTEQQWFLVPPFLKPTTITQP